MNSARTLGGLVLAAAIALAGACGEDAQKPLAPTVAEGPDAADDAPIRDSAIAVLEAAPLECAPLSTTGLVVPDAGPFPPLGQDACANVVLTGMIDCALGLSKGPACDSLLAQPSTVRCRACAMGPVGGPTPILITTDGYAKLNLAACVARVTEAMPGFADCGALVTAREACVEHACGHCVVATSPVSFETCATAARLGSCKPYAVEAARCLGVSSPESPLAICTAPAGFTDQAAAYANLFCMAPPDAGTDAPSD